MLAISCVAALLLSQQAGPPDMGGREKIEKMQAFAKLVGEWEGTAWMEIGGRRSETKSYEKVEFKAGGTVLAVTGIHSIQIPGRDAPMVVHDAFGVITWRDGKYMMHSDLATGASGDFEIKLTDAGIKWEVPVPSIGNIRYESTITPDTWIERGYNIGDGDKQVSEMTLKRKS
ncbi:MAG: hypothetical protein KF812_03065 [Fimbriimonadaceae bacterium]|nr:hypothetical protein [Fimbriimonadaceae bacterium]